MAELALAAQLEPMISSCLKNRRGRLSSTSGPEVPPQTHMRPPWRRVRTECSQVAGPTLSTTMSAVTGYGFEDSNQSAAPSSTALRPLSASREVT